MLGKFVRICLTRCTAPPALTATRPTTMTAHRCTLLRQRATSRFAMFFFVCVCVQNYRQHPKQLILLLASLFVSGRAPAPRVGCKCPCPRPVGLSQDLASSSPTSNLLLSMPRFGYTPLRQAVVAGHTRVAELIARTGGRLQMSNSECVGEGRGGG